MVDGEELSARRRAVLGLVVRDYIAAAQPVGSLRLVQQYSLEYSSATVRNELAALEKLGYLTQPHTSAGRVPTEKGYRYFVERLLAEAPLPLSDQRMIRHQFHQASLEMEQWVHLAAAVLANTTHSAALATVPKALRCRFKHLELISVRDNVVLLVLVLLGGTVKQQMLHLKQPLSQEELSQLSNQLNEALAQADVAEIDARLAQSPVLATEVGQLVADIMYQIDCRSSERIFSEGLTHLLSEPEFADSEEARRVVQVLEQRPLLDTILEEMRERDGVQVLIGGEGRWAELSQASLVLSSYGDEEVFGMLGVLGPLRMAYSRTIPTVRYVAGLMSGLVQEWYG
ncbi:MAG: heat-inducible transcription repressor HrcA [Chloroflexi bacterium]|nr:heat-inducible transcription repressor HrcA [Chloroflexota bacterium]